MVGPNNYGFAIGGLPGDGALRSGSELFTDLLLCASLFALDAISSLEPFFLNFIKRQFAIKRCETKMTRRVIEIQHFFVCSDAKKVKSESRC